MKQKVWKVLFTIFLSSILLLKSSQLSNGMAWADRYQMLYTFFDPFITEVKLKDFFFSFRTFYGAGVGFPKENVDENLLEWSNYFENQATKGDINYIIYKTDNKDLSKIEGSFEKSAYSLKDTLVKNSLVKYWRKKPEKAKEVIAYLKYAQRTEPMLQSYNPYWNGNEEKTKSFIKEKAKVDKYIKKALTRAKKTQNEFLKLRYTFQVVRLAYYNDKPETCIKFADKMLNMPQASILKYWAMAYKAGVLKDKNLFFKANYLFSLVFANSTNKRIFAYRSMSIKNQFEWQQTLKLCRNNKERSTLYFIRAFDLYSNAEEEMQYIYQLDPNSKYLEVLLSREINKLEQDILGVFDSASTFVAYGEAKDGHYRGFPRKESIQYLKRLKKLCQKIIKDEKVNNLALWQIGEGYLEYLEGNLQKSKDIFRRVSQQESVPDKLRQQVQICDFLLEIDLTKKITLQKEVELFDKYLRLESNNPLAYNKHIFGYMLSKLSKKYRKQGNFGKAYACIKNYENLKYVPNLTIVNQILQIIEKPKKTKFEKYLLVQFQGGNIISPRYALAFSQNINISKETPENPNDYSNSIFFLGHGKKENMYPKLVLMDIVQKNTYSKVEQFIWSDMLKNLKYKLLEMKGTLHLNNSEFEKAEEVFEKLPYKYTGDVGLNPFMEIDIPDATFYKKKKEGYYSYEDYMDKKEIAGRLVEIQNEIRKYPQKVENYVKMGNYYYNVSYWGHTWKAVRYYSGHRYNYGHSINYQNVINLTNNVDFSKAFFYYQKALNLAKKEGEKELATYTCYLLAKCEQKTYFAKNMYKSGKPYKNPQSYFKKLKSEFSDTEYYKEIIEECNYFNHFLKEDV